MLALMSLVVSALSAYFIVNLNQTFTGDAGYARVYTELEKELSDPPQFRISFSSNAWQSFFLHLCHILRNHICCVFLLLFRVRKSMTISHGRGATPV